MRPDESSESDAAEPLFFEPTPGPGDSEGGDVYPPEGMSGALSHALDVREVAERLGPGGYEIVYESPRVEVGVYVLVAPEPDGQEPHEWDELYVVLEGRATLSVEGEDYRVEEGGAVFVPASAEHRFDDYERVVLLVLFDRG